MSVLLADIIASSGVQFGTSGARGLVVDFTDDVCAAFTQSFLQVMQQGTEVRRLALAIDNRPSSLSMAAACAGAAQAQGITVDYYGVLPTPALAYKAILDKVPALMVTGSHIPFDRNGLKFYRPDGEITKLDEQAILAVDQPLERYTAALPEQDSAAAQCYVDRYVQFFPSQLLAGKHIGIYQHSGSGRDLYPQVFEALGAKITCLERTDTFVPIDTEAVSEADKTKSLNWAKEYAFDAIFSTDGDGDRPLIADEKGGWLRGDIVGLLCAKALKIEALAVPVNCNTAIEKSAAFDQVVRTKIGSPYVLAAFENLSKKSNCYAGFEANGGFILGSAVNIVGKALAALPTRDALLPFLTIMALAAGKPLSTLAASLPQRYTASDRLKEVPTDLSQRLIAEGTSNPAWLLITLGIEGKQIQLADQTDGLRLTLTDGDVLHLRPSGNAPELRCYSESDTANKAESLVATVLLGLRRLIKSGY